MPMKKGYKTKNTSTTRSQKQVVAKAMSKAGRGSAKGSRNKRV